MPILECVLQMSMVLNNGLEHKTLSQIMFIWLKAKIILKISQSQYSMTQKEMKAYLRLLKHQ